MNQYRIGELAEKAGVSRRTVHYYMSRGLLPQPDGAGLGTTYSDEHLYRIMLIKKLQDGYLPLNEIRKRIVTLSLEEIKSYLDNNFPLSTLEESAVDYKPQACTGNVFERINVAWGVEIHFPVGDHKAEELAQKLNKYAEQILKEG